MSKKNCCFTFTPQLTTNHRNSKESKRYQPDYLLNYFDIPIKEFETRIIILTNPSHWLFFEIMLDINCYLRSSLSALFLATKCIVCILRLITTDIKNRTQLQPLLWCHLSIMLYHSSVNFTCKTVKELIH